MSVPPVTGPAELPRSSRVAIALMFPALAIPVAGFLVAAELTAWIPIAADGTMAIVNMLAVDFFAAVLAVSMLINAIVATARRGSRPSAYRAFAKLPFFVYLLLGLGIAWLVVLVISRGVIQLAEPLLAISIAAVSIVVCVFATLPDAASRQYAAERRSLRAIQFAALPAEVRMARRRTRRRLLAIGGILIAAALVVGGAVVAVGAIVPVRHTNCEINSIFYGDDGSPVKIDTTHCGSFDYAGGAAAYNRLSRTLELATVDIVSKGWTLDLPPAQTAISITRHRG
jgi:hypothetical protein